VRFGSLWHVDDERKLQFTYDALQQQQDPFQDPFELESELMEAVSWAASRSVEQVIIELLRPLQVHELLALQVMRERESAIAKLEASAAWYW